MSSLISHRVLNCLKRVPPSIKPLHIRCISTSKKNRETTTLPTEKIEACETQSKVWVSYGFSEANIKEDRHYLHMTMFFGVTMLMVFGGFILAYKPDYLGRDWAQREAFLELRRREQSGLPLVDPNYLPLDKIILPTDEELGNIEIVI